MRLLLFILGLLLVCHGVLAAPAIVEVSGDIVHGQSMSIVGSGFGDKVPVAPYRWDDFQDGIPGEYLVDVDDPDGGIWDLQYYDCRLPTYSVGEGVDGSSFVQRREGDVSALQNFEDRQPPDWIEGCATNRGFGVIDKTPSAVWYVSYWAFQDDYAGTAMNSANVKITPAFWHHSWNQGTGAQWEQNWDTGSDCYVALASRCDEETVMHQRSTHGPTNKLNDWGRFESSLDMGDPGVANGYHSGVLDLETKAEFSGMLTPAACAERDLLSSFWFGLNFRSDNGAVMHQYVSELYVDHTFARIEIGDAPNWGDCSHREIQIPVSGWDDGTGENIDFEVNVGSFSQAEIDNGLYLFVVDEFGDVSDGFPLSVDGPHIASLSVDVLSHGASVTVNGLNFGVKDPVAPFIWDTLENGAAFIGQMIPDVPGSVWDADGSAPVYSTTWAHSGLVAASNEVTPWSDNHWAYMYIPGVEPGEDIYMTNWFNSIGVGDDDDKCDAKLNRITASPAGGGAGRYNGVGANQVWWAQIYPASHPSGPTNPDNPHGAQQWMWPEEDGFTVLGYTTGWWNRPVRLEHYIKLSSPGVQDGLHQTRMVSTSGNSYFSQVVANRGAGEIFMLDTALFGCGATNFEGDFTFFMDDLYADTTQARIEIANCQEFYDCDYREIQIPHTIWVDGVIEFDVNLGGFTQGDIDAGLYLFVIDENGEVSNAYGPLVFGLPEPSVPGDLNGDLIVTLADLFRVTNLYELVLVGRNI